MIKISKYNALRNFNYYLPQHCLYLRPEPHGFWYLGFWELLKALGSLIRRLAALGSTP